MAGLGFSQRIALLVSGHLVLASVPMLVAMVAAPALAPTPSPAPAQGMGGRGLWVEFGVALGYAALGLFAVQFVLIGRVGVLSRRIGQDSLLGLHKWAGIAAAAFLWAHPVVLIAARPGYAEFFDPRVNAPRALALAAALAAITGLIVLSVLRRRLGLPYEWWRLTHAGLAALLMLIALAHSVMVGHYTSTIATIAMTAAFCLAPLAILGWVHVVGPLRRRPWRVSAVEPVRPRVWAVELTTDDQNAGIAFEPGQFAWLAFGDGPLQLRQHPFTIASSAGAKGQRQQRLAFTIKELGDFTATIGQLPVGTRAWVEGPAGGFGLPPHARGAILIAGGIGITPMLSILRTMADRGDRRRAILLYGNETLEKAAHTDELEALGKRLDLAIIHVPEQPPEHAPDGWQGPSGYIDRAMLERVVDRDRLEGDHALVCGPDAMMDAVEDALLALGVGRERIHSERFNIV
ncbi:MAG: ferredoxin reductase family protein [Phycisphaeraceae bacterium]|nr:ferredoxin reductase family protein [Phycisphaeraceae bacterium]